MAGLDRTGSAHVPSDCFLNNCMTAVVPIQEDGEVEYGVGSKHSMAEEKGQEAPEQHVAASDVQVSRHYATLLQCTML